MESYKKEKHLCPYPIKHNSSVKTLYAGFWYQINELCSTSHCESPLSGLCLCFCKLSLHYKFPHSLQYVFLYHFNSLEHSAPMWQNNTNALNGFCVFMQVCVVHAYI